MVEIMVGDICWEFYCQPTGVIVIRRGDRILGYIHKDIPHGEDLFIVALDAIREDISREVEKERKQYNKR